MYNTAVIDNGFSSVVIDLPHLRLLPLNFSCPFLDHRNECAVVSDDELFLEPPVIVLVCVLDLFLILVRVLMLCSVIRLRYSCRSSTNEMNYADQTSHKLGETIASQRPGIDIGSDKIFALSSLLFVALPAIVSVIKEFFLDKASRKHRKSYNCDFPWRRDEVSDSI